MTITSTTSRRAILAGAAALPALTVSSLAATADPIFAAIEAHKRAYVKRLEALALHFADEKDKVASAASQETMTAFDNASMELLKPVPITLGGALALINYVDAFNRGEYKFEDMKSNVAEWPVGDLVDEEDYNEAAARSGEFGFPLAVLLNVRDALAALAVQS